MLISHKYRFIFIKTQKTGGTSLEVDFSRAMADDDVATPVRPPEKGHVWRNIISEYGDTLGERVFTEHMSASEIRKRVTPEVWNSYFKFCIEREPVDKCISDYSHIMAGARGEDVNLTWREYLSKAVLPSEVNMYTDGNGHLLVDRILKYEHYQKEVREVADMLGFPIKLITSRSKTGFRLNNIKPSLQDRIFIYDFFAPSLRYTGYRLWC